MSAQDSSPDTYMKSAMTCTHLFSCFFGHPSKHTLVAMHFWPHRSNKRIKLHANAHIHPLRPALDFASLHGFKKKNHLHFLQEMPFSLNNMTVKKTTNKPLLLSHSTLNYSLAWSRGNRSTFLCFSYISFPLKCPGIFL